MVVRHSFRRSDGIRSPCPFRPVSGAWSDSRAASCPPAPRDSSRLAAGDLDHPKRRGRCSVEICSSSAPPVPHHGCRSWMVNPRPHERGEREVLRHDRWLVPGYRLIGWALLMIVFDAALGPRGRVVGRPPPISRFQPARRRPDVGGDRTLGAPIAPSPTSLRSRPAPRGDRSD